jgi:hypothetical protein
MSIILGLLIACLGLYFLSLFFQMARLEKNMTEGVTVLEKYMINKYSLGEEKVKKAVLTEAERSKGAVEIKIPTQGSHPAP